MIYAIAALDVKKGIATEEGIPWDLQADKIYFREMTTGSPVVMGYGLYSELKSPLLGRRNLVIIRPGTELRHGFEAIENTDELLDQFRNSIEVLWVIVGAKIYAELLPDFQKLYLTRILADFNCTKFFPDFEDQFELIDKQPVQRENGLGFWMETWQRPGLSQV